MPAIGGADIESVDGYCSRGHGPLLQHDPHFFLNVKIYPTHPQK